MSPTRWTRKFPEVSNHFGTLPLYFESTAVNVPAAPLQRVLKAGKSSSTSRLINRLTSSLGPVRVPALLSLVAVFPRTYFLIEKKSTGTFRLKVKLQTDRWQHSWYSPEFIREKHHEVRLQKQARQQLKTTKFCHKGIMLVQVLK